jgi:transcriptional regulator with XRE-family HTH domain
MSRTDSLRFSRDRCSEAEAVGHALRTARESAGLSIARIALASAFSESHLRSAENGNRVVTIDIADAYDRALDAGGAIVGLFAAFRDDDDAGDAWQLTPAEAAASVSGLWLADLRRRSVVASAWAAGALAGPLSGWLADSADQDASSGGGRRVGQADVDAVWSMCAAFADADHQLGGGHARATLSCYGDGVVTPLLSGSYTDQVGRRLFAAAARLCDIAGFMCFDSGCQGLGQRYFVRALRLTKTSGDQALGAHILTDMSMQAQHLGHAREALMLADAGVAATGRSGSGSTLARCHAIRARALALTGDAAGSDHALNQAERALDRARPGGEPFWITFFTARQLATESMYAAASMGRGGLVRQHAAQVLDAEDGMHRRHVLAAAALAQSYLPGDAMPDAASDVDRACEAMRAVLPVVGSLTSTRALDAVSVVRRRLGAYRLPVVRELEQDLRQCLAGAGTGS